MSIFHHNLRHAYKRRFLTQHLLLFFAMAVMLLSCGGGGGEGSISSQSSPGGSGSLEEKAITNLVEEYRNAMMQEDIDRLDELLLTQASPAPAAALNRQVQSSEETDDTPGFAQTFCDNMSNLFNTKIITGMLIPGKDYRIATDHRSVSFWEIKYEEDPDTLAQRTLASRKTFKLVRQIADNGMESFLIAGVTEDGPHFEVSTPGRVLAGSLTRLVVTASSEESPIKVVEIEESASGVHRTLARVGSRFHGTFTPTYTGQHALPVSIHWEGDYIEFEHRYRLRTGKEGVAQRIAGTETSALLAVAVSPEETVWTGGRNGRLYKVAPGSSIAEPITEFIEDPSMRLEDLVIDGLGNLHIPFLTINKDTDSVDSGGVIAFDVDEKTLKKTVKLFGDGYYPFWAHPITDDNTDKKQRSPITRVCLAGNIYNGGIWLFGSDGGVARYKHSLWTGPCTKNDCYDRIFSRENGLLSNRVPAMVVGSDDALWFGTAFGLTRWYQERFTPVMFRRDLAFRGDVKTLEAFYSKVAAAIFDARPISGVGIGEGKERILFVEEFRRSLIKEDLIFSALEDSRGRFWAGTLGGGLRRIEIVDDSPEDTLLLTRKEGLVSNIIFALAEGPDGSIWAATEEGVSRIQDKRGRVKITNFSALNGLDWPVRDVAVDRKGTAWLATDGGLYRILPQEESGRVHGDVKAPAGSPVAGADICMMDTPFCTVTDTDGRFALANLPPGSYRLHVDGSLASDGPYTQKFESEMTVTAGTISMDPVEISKGILIDPPAKGGKFTFPGKPDVEIVIPENAVQFPAGAPHRIALTVLPLEELPAFPKNRKAIAAVDLQPDGTEFSKPFHLNLRYDGFAPTNGWLDVLELDQETMTYKKIGDAAVDVYGSVIKTGESQGLNHFSTVVFALSASPPVHVMQGGQGTSQIDLPDAKSFKIKNEHKLAFGRASITSKGKVTYHANKNIPTGSDIRDIIEVTVTDSSKRETTVEILVSIFSEEQIRFVPVSRRIRSAVKGAKIPFVVQITNLFKQRLRLQEIAVNAERITGKGNFDLSEEVATTQQSLIAKAQDSHLIVTVTTDTEGQAKFVFEVDPGEDDQIEQEDIEIKTSLGQAVHAAHAQGMQAAIEQEQTFLAIVGAVDTSQTPLDLAVGEKYFYMADKRSGLKIINIKNPGEDVKALNLCGEEVRLSLAADRPGRLYVATNGPARLYILNIEGSFSGDDSDPCDKDQINKLKEQGVLLGMVEIPPKDKVEENSELTKYSISGLEIKGDFAYVVTAAPSNKSGSLQVVDISQETDPDWKDFILLDCQDGQPLDKDCRPNDIEIRENMAYVPAEDGGLLTIDLTNPEKPTQSDDTLPGTFSFGLVLDGALAYTVETKAKKDYFTVLNISKLLNQDNARQGAVQIAKVPQGAVASAIALNGSYAYIVQGALGLQKIDIKKIGIEGQDPLMRLFSAPTVALNTVSAGGDVYFTDQREGLRVLDEDTDEDENAGDKGPSFDRNRTTVWVDAATTMSLRNGTKEYPYRSITEGLQALQQSHQSGLLKLNVKPGTYSALTTQEVFPLDLSGLSNLKIWSEWGQEEQERRYYTVIDAGFTAEAIKIEGSANDPVEELLIEGIIVVHGVLGFVISGNAPRKWISDNWYDSAITLLDSRVTDSIFTGIYLKADIWCYDPDDCFPTDLTADIIDTVIDHNGNSGLYNYYGTVRLLDSQISHNSAEVGGGIDNFAGNISVIDSLIWHNWASLGGGIETFDGQIMLANSIIDNNWANWGGGISNDGNCKVWLTDSILSNNAAYHNGGGIDTFGGQITITNSTLRNNQADWGGGIVSDGGGIVTLSNSTLNDNFAVFSGGGISNLSAKVTLTNCTFSNNFAFIPTETLPPTCSPGSDLYNNGGTATLTNCTLSDDLVDWYNWDDSCAGLYNEEESTLKLKNTIVARNRILNCNEPGIFDSLGYNLANDDTCKLNEPTDLLYTDPILGPLSDNGGPTWTQALIDDDDINDNPAFNWIPPGINGCGTTITADQRGVSRPQGNSCDIGAYELIVDN